MDAFYASVEQRDRPETLIAHELKKKIFQRTGGLTSSAGVSFNKFIAKVASDINKPDGITVITPDVAEEFIDKFLCLLSIQMLKIQKTTH